MTPARGSVLAGLVLVALAAPAAVFAVASADDDGDRPAPATAHSTKHGHHDKSAGPEDTTGSEHADDASAVGRAHAAAMKAWARCVAEAASGPKAGERTGPPKDACGDKPVGPGRAKHDAASPSHQRGLGKSHGHGHSHSR